MPLQTKCCLTINEVKRIESLRWRKDKGEGWN